MNDTLVFSIALGTYDILFKSCIQSHKEYCKKYGYEYKVITNTYKDLSASESSWLKIPLIVNAIEAGYKNIFFVDADCEIRKHAPPVDQLMEGAYSLFLAPGISGRINAGVIIVKNTSDSLAFFNNIIQQCEITIPKEDFAAFENGHMIHFGKNNPIVKMISHNQWNNNSTFDENSYVQHFSNGKAKLRQRYLKMHPITYFIVRVANLLSKFKGKKAESGNGLNENLLALKKYHRM